MDTDERNQKLSRLVKETEECNRAIAALEQRLQGFYETLTEIAFQLNAVWNPKPNPAGSVQKAILAATWIPECRSIVAILNELQAERNRAASLKGQLGSMDSHAHEGEPN
jgi:hypothetical protein